jgi:hypothetical protein
MLVIVPDGQIRDYRLRHLSTLLEELVSVYGKDCVIQFDVEGYGAITFDPGRTVADLHQSDEQSVEQPAAPVDPGTGEKSQSKAKN